MRENQKKNYAEGPREEWERREVMSVKKISLALTPHRVNGFACIDEVPREITMKRFIEISNKTQTMFNDWKKNSL